ncbi:MAG: GNAT family N-acetyltransferase [Saprospiraceae bacterium]
MQLSYKKLSLQDLRLTQKLGRETYEPLYHHKWKPGGLDWYMEKCFGAEILKAELCDPNIEYWLPEDELGQSVGILKLVLQKPVPDFPVENALYLEKIYLFPNFIGKGAGQIIIEFARQRALQLQREAVWLTVMKSGPVAAYERAGFHTIGEVRWDFELLKEHERAGWIMVRPLESA